MVCKLQWARTRYRAHLILNRFAMRRAMMRGFTMFSACVASTACTTFAPVPVTGALPGQEVRVRLTPHGMIELGQLLGGGAVELNGRVISATDSALTMSVVQVTRLTGVGETWNGERATIALTDVSAVERPRPAVARSVLGAGIFVAGIYFIGRSFGRGNVTGSHDTGGGTGGQQ